MPEGSSSVISGFREFEFDLPEALLASMVLTFDTMEAAPLTFENLAGVPDAQGVYQLFVGDEIVYIGKTDSEAGLSRRLNRHAWTIQHRCNLVASEVLFKAVRVFVFTAIDLETQLIKHYKGRSKTNWNNSGFGSNDPGRNRDNTRASPKSFDVLYPINLDEPIDLGVSRTLSAAEVLQALRAHLPYTVRAEGSGTVPRLIHADLESSQVILGNAQNTTRIVILAVLKSLPPGWQATALAGRVILYRETKEYPSGAVIGRS
jgi:hypothetical protein